METLYTATFTIVLLAVAAAMLAYYLKISIALIEIVVGIIGGYLLNRWLPAYHLDLNSAWFTMLASVSALMLTFLAGLELDAEHIKQEWRTALVIGLASFITPFLACGAIAYYGFAWSLQASLLTGLVLSTTSVAIVYGSLLEGGLTETDYGKTLLAICFVTDFCTVMTLGLIFTPFTFYTILFFISVLFICAILPVLCKILFAKFGRKPTAFEFKFILLALILLGIFAISVGYEPVLPAFFVGIALSNIVGNDSQLVKSLQTTTFGLLTPFYFIRAGFLVSVPVLLTSSLPILIFLAAKIFFKGIGISPCISFMNAFKPERMYTLLLMSTGLAFGSIAALFGLTHHIINANQYSLLIAVVVLSAIVPAVFANLFFFPKKLIQNNH